MKSLLVLVLGMLLSVNSWAAERTLQCEVILAASDLSLSQGTWKFETTDNSEDHGGAARVFSEGRYRVEVLADGQWLGLSWFRDGKKLAEGIFVVGFEDQVKNRVGVLYDPTDSGDQLSLGCGTKK